MFAIGIDIGGTSIKAGLVDGEGKIIYSNRKKTESTPTKCIDNMILQIKDILNSNNLTISDIKGIGLGSPGLVTSKTGVVEHAANLGWTGVRVVDELKKHFDTTIKLSNDANVAALAESFYGCAKNYDSSVMFTLGTGVGGGIIIDNQLFEGYQSKGAEVGHTTLILDGEPCTCGRKGCIESYVSATALIRQTKEEMKNNPQSLMWQFVDNDIDKVDGRTAFECSKQGDKSAKKVVDTYVKYLSESMMNFFNIIRPEAFILGGGVSAQGEYLVEKVKKYCEEHDYGFKRSPKVEILIATLGNDAGIIGAASLVI